MPARFKALLWMLAFFAVTGGWCFYKFQSWQDDLREHPEKRGALGGEPVAIPPPEVSRASKVREANLKSPDQALALAMELLDGGTPTEQRETRELLPTIYENRFQAALRAHDWDRAERALNDFELVSTTSKDFRVAAERARRNWNDAQLERLRDLATQGKAAEAEALYLGMVNLTSGRAESARNAMRPLVAKTLADWKTLKASGDATAATEKLNFAANVLAGDESRNELQQALEAGQFTFDALMRDGTDAQTKSRFALALAYFGAAEVAARRNARGNSADADLATVRAHHRDTVLAAVGAARLGLYKWLSVENARRLAESEANTISLDARGLDAREKERRLESLLALRKAACSLDTAAFERATDDEQFEEAMRVYRRLNETSVAQLLRDRARYENLDLVAALPKALLEKAQLPPGDSAEQKRGAVALMIQRGDWVPEVEENARARALYPRVEIESALRRYDEAAESNRETALDQVRFLMRKYQGQDAFKRIAARLQDRVRGALATRDFSALVDVLTFYVSEVGPPLKADPFRNELKEALRASVAHFEKDAQMKRLFLLTLIAGTFPDEPEGKAAEEEANAQGLDVIARGKTSELRENEAQMPSGVPGFSAVAVNNGTSYHLLMFFSGPERFFVRLNPMRRGTVVLRDGEYEVGVVVTRDDITPNRGKRSFKSFTTTGTYRLVRTVNGVEQKDWVEGLAQTQGPFVLLRAPVDAPPVEVEPVTGLLMRK